MNMAEDKAEGEVRETSSGSSVVEGKMTSGNEQQLETVEEQLERAQATLLDLQNLKAKLEAERRVSRLKEIEEQEILASKKIKEENTTLRHELRGYQGEINSLKDIIGSLKDDLVRTAERLSEKVDTSLRAIGEPVEEPHKVVHKKVHHKAKPVEPLEHNFFNDHLTPPAKIEPDPDPEIETETNEHIENIVADEPIIQAKPVESSPIQEAIAEAPEAAAPANESPAQMAAATPEVQPQPQEAMVEAPQEETPAVAITAQMAAAMPEAPAQPAASEANQEVPAASNNPEVISKAEDPAVAPEPVQPQPDELDEDLLEYEAIKRELMEMEEDHVFVKADSSEAPAPSAQTIADDQPEKAKKAGPLTLFKKTLFKPKSAENEDSSSNKISGKARGPKHHFWSRKTEAPAQPAPVAPIPEAQPIQQAAPETVAPAVPVTPVAAQPAPISEVQPPPVATVPESAAQTIPSPVLPEAQPIQQVAPTPVASLPEAPKAAKPAKQFSDISNVFKKRKKKVTGEIGEDHTGGKKRSGGGGKVLARAAIFILVLAGAGTAYRISNAEALRQMYNSKAQESVQSTTVKQVPDGFNDIAPEVKYREAYVDAPFADTVWTNYKDAELGILLDYPQNTSYRLKPVGSDNLWFLRKNGYLLKIEKINASGTIEQYARDITDGVKYNIEQLNIRDHKTLHLVLQEDLPVKGNMYLVQMDGAVIYKIWYKTFLPDENSDDEQRVKKMLDTLDFIKIKK